MKNNQKTSNAQIKRCGVYNLIIEVKSDTFKNPKTTHNRNLSCNSKECSLHNQMDKLQCDIHRLHPNTEQ